MAKTSLVEKVLYVGTCIPTPNGMVLLKVLHSGDKVFGEKGHACTIINVSDVISGDNGMAQVRKYIDRGKNYVKEQEIYGASIPLNLDRSKWEAAIERSLKNPARPKAIRSANGSKKKIQGRMKLDVSEELWNKSGVYMITNMLDPSKIYIGSAKKLKRRYRNHISSYRNGRHSCAKLARAFDKYGIENFTFTVMELCEPENNISREQDYIDRLKPYYNIRKIANSCLGITHLPYAKTRRKGFDHPNSKGATQYNMAGDKIRDFGSITLAVAYIGQNSTANILSCCKGIKYSAGGYRWSYLGEGLPEREMLSNPNSRAVTQYSLDGTRIRDFGSIALAAKEVARNKNLGPFIKCCQGKGYSAGGYRWSYAGEDLAEIKKPEPPNLKAVTQYTMCGDKIRDFRSIAQAAADTGQKGGANILNCCTGKRNDAGGYRWSYAGEDLPERKRK